MESKNEKDYLRNLILDMAHKALEEHMSSNKGAQKYFEGNVDRIIENNIKKVGKERSSDLMIYPKIIKQGTYQDNIMAISKLIKKEELFKSKNELIKFARYLGININSKNSSYSQILKKICRHIYSNKNEYSKKYVIYKRGNYEYILEPEKLKMELIESYKSKTRDDMKSIARLLDLNVKEDEGAEDIRKKVINYIIKEKLSKKNK